MALVPVFQRQSLQDLLHTVLMADRHLQAANESLNALLDLVDWLEDTPAPSALFTLRQSIQALGRTIFYISVVKIQKLVELQRALNVYMLHQHRAPLVDLDW